MSAGFWVPVEAFWLTGGWPPVTYTDAPSGGLVLGGSDVDGKTGADTRSAGLILGGSVVESRSASDSATGGLILGGTRVEARAAGDVETASLILGGSVTESHSTADAPSGGLRLGGTMTEARSTSDTPTGGLVLGGAEVDSTVPLTAPPVEGGLQTLLAMLRPRPRPAFVPRPRPLTVTRHSSWPAGGIVMGGRIAETHTTAPIARVPAPVDDWQAEIAELLALDLV